MVFMCCEEAMKPPRPSARESMEADNSPSIALIHLLDKVNIRTNIPQIDSADNFGDDALILKIVIEVFGGIARCICQICGRNIVGNYTNISLIKSLDPSDSAVVSFFEISY